MAESFQYMNGLSAKTLALILHRWGRVGRPVAPLAREIDRLVNNAAVYANFMPDDLGLLLNAQGVSILQERVDLDREKRLELGQATLQRALEYEPTISAAWANLALISAVRGDCQAAARFQTSAVATITETKETEEVARRALQLFQAAALDPDVCRKATAAAAHLFPGF
jgi:hypothetical protein